MSYGKDKRRKRKEYDRYRHAYISQRTSRGVEGSRNVVRLYRRCLLEPCQRSRFSVASCAAMRRPLRPRAMPTAVRDNETSAKAARSFCHLYPLRDRNIITPPSLPSFLSSLHAVPPGRTDSRLSIFILSCSWKPVARPSIERAGGAVN